MGRCRRTRSRIGDHLDVCPFLRGVPADHRTTIAMSASAGRTPRAEDVPEELVQAILLAKAQECGGSAAARGVPAAVGAYRARRLRPPTDHFEPQKHRAVENGRDSPGHRHLLATCRFRRIAAGGARRR